MGDLISQKEEDNGDKAADAQRYEEDDLGIAISHWHV